MKIDNLEEAKEYGIEKIPSLLYFEKGIPTLYEGNLEDEEKVLKWLETQQKTDQIEDITDEVLDMIIEKMPHVAVLFCQWLISFLFEDLFNYLALYKIDIYTKYHLMHWIYFIIPLTDDKDQKKSQKILGELENIDDDCDQHNIAFVKISDLEEAKEYGIESLPTLVFFEKRIPHVYEGTSKIFIRFLKFSKFFMSWSKSYRVLCKDSRSFV